MNYWNKEIECAPRSEIEALQSYRLSRTIRRVYENVAPYRKKMDEAGVRPEDIKSIADLSKLPFTTKQDLRNNYPYGMFAVPSSEVVRIHASSGTTGKQTVVGYTAHDIDVWAECAARALTNIGGTRMIMFRSATVTDCSQAVLVCTTEQKSSVLPLFPHRQETACVSLKCSGISALL